MSAPVGFLPSFANTALRLTSLAVRLPDNDLNFSAYIRAELFHPKGDQEWKSKAIKVKDVSPEFGADFIYNERFHWDYESEELAFIRCVFHHCSHRLLQLMVNKCQAVGC